MLSGRANFRVDVPVMPRVGLCRTPDWDFAEPSMQSALIEAGELFKKAGCRVIEVTPPSPFEKLGNAHWTVMAFEAARAVHPEMRTRREHVSEVMRNYVDLGAAISIEDYDAAKAMKGAGFAAFNEAMTNVDVLLTPPAPGEAPMGLSATGDPVFNRVWTLLGVPCITIPFGKGPHGLPLGVQDRRPLWRRCSAARSRRLDRAGVEVSVSAGSALTDPGSADSLGA